MKSKHLIPFWILAPLMAFTLLVMPSSQASVSFAPSTIVSVPIYEEVLPASGAELSNAFAIKDYAGNKFTTWVRLVGNDTRVMMQKRDPQGNIVGTNIVLASNGRKMNSSGVFLDGADLVVTLTAKELTPLTRINGVEEARWAGVAVPFPNGINPALGGGPQTFVAQAPAVEINYGQIRADVKAELQATIPGLVRQELQSQGVLTERMLDGERGSAIVYNQLRATSYSGALDAINKVGACKAP